MTTETVPTGWLPIQQYRDFWDVPRMFLVEFAGNVFLFDCAFDEEREDFNTAYEVYQLPLLSETDLKASWAKLPSRPVRELGIVPVSTVTFDPTRKIAIDGRVFASLLAVVKTVALPSVASNVRA